MFTAAKSSWLPLVGAQLVSVDKQELPGVNTLAWDSSSAVLYIGGTFIAQYGDGVEVPIEEGRPSTTGLAAWSEQQGLIPFPGGGLFRDSGGGAGVAFRIAYESQSSVSDGNT
jgi:hypothetical protein